MSDLKCSEYVNDDCYASQMPCKCPVCGGFLRWKDEQPICTKCGVDLFTIPERDEETGEQLEWGKICALPNADEKKKEDERI